MQIANEKQKILDNDPEEASKRAAVKRWLATIARAKLRWEADFKRMKRNIEFVYGLQREGQTAMSSDEYQVNLTVRHINQRVASLYARNPTVEWQRRDRLDFQVWDGKMESIMPLYQRITLAQSMGIQPPLAPADVALMQDFMQGHAFKEQVERVGQTLQRVYQYQVDEHDPNFKLQMKALVRRVCTTGVGYVLPSFVRDVDAALSSTGLDDNVADRIKLLQQNLEQLQDENLDKANPRLEQVKSLMASIMLAGQKQYDDVSERLMFDFLPSTSVIPDENCTNLKGFVGARAVFIEYVLPLDEINAFFGTSIEAGSITALAGDGEAKELGREQTADAPPRVLGCLYRVLDKQSKSDCFVLEGYKDYLQEPAGIEPCIRGFWPLFALTFNDTESHPGTKATIFPPSDVDLLWHPQKEWNRTREELRKHRNANAAKYLTQKGMLTPEDLGKLENAESNAVIELQLNDPKADVNKVLVPMTHAPVDPALYDTSPLDNDILRMVGAQEANIGSPNPKGTATGQAIAEQSRNVGLSSNVDDLDDFLGLLADAGGQLLMQEMSAETVKRIVGVGASWPQENRSDFLNEIYLKHVAASSGRPNKAVELQNWQMLLPFLVQIGANPQFLAREMIKRLDDRLDPADAFPLVPGGAPMPMPGPAGPGMLPGPQQQPQQPPRSQRRPGPGRLGPRPAEQQNA